MDLPARGRLCRRQRRKKQNRWPSENIGSVFSWNGSLCQRSKPCDEYMQHGGLAVIECGKGAIDRGAKLVRLGDAFAVSAEGFCDVGKIPPVALTAGRQPRLELIGLGRDDLL